MSGRDFPLIDGFAPSWANVKSTVAIYRGEDFQTRDWAAIKFGETVEVGEQYGTGALVQAYTTGKLKTTGSMEMWFDKGTQFQAALAKVNTSIALVHFDLIYSFELPGVAKPITVKLQACRVLGRALEISDGVEPAKWSFEDIRPKRASVNGIVLFGGE